MKISKTVLLTIIFMLLVNCGESTKPKKDKIETGTVTDIDGNTYKTVKIGDQWWMAENLRVTKYRNGEAISNITDDTQWNNMWQNNTQTSVYCAYNNDESIADDFGYLYNWFAVNDNRNIAPVGWHVPTDGEWEELAQYISNDNGGSYDKDEYGNWYNVGTHLKSTSGWNDNDGSSGNGTDDYGFAGLPASFRNTDGTFGNMDIDTYFWSTSEYESGGAWGRYLRNRHTRFSRTDLIREFGLSVRLLKD